MYYDRYAKYKNRLYHYIDTLRHTDPVTARRLARQYRKGLLRGYDRKLRDLGGYGDSDLMAVALLTKDGIVEQQWMAAVLVQSEVWRDLINLIQT